MLIAIIEGAFPGNHSRQEYGYINALRSSAGKDLTVQEFSILDDDFGISAPDDKGVFQIF